MDMTNKVDEFGMPATEPATADRVRAIAIEFAKELREWLTPEEMEQVIALNTSETDDIVCHSHDFCDANMALDAAFNRVMGRDWDGDDADDTDVMNRAWAAAKAANFDPAAIGQAPKTEAVEGKTMFKEFPEVEFPKWLRDLGFEDLSWHNDAMPQATKQLGDDLALVMWVNYPNKEDREMMKDADYALVIHRTTPTGAWLDTGREIAIGDEASVKKAVQDTFREWAYDEKGNRLGDPSKYESKLNESSVVVKEFGPYVVVWHKDGGYTVDNGARVVWSTGSKEDALKAAEHYQQNPDSEPSDPEADDPFYIDEAAKQKPAPDAKGLLDFVTDHAKHFKAMPLEYAEDTDDGENVWKFDEYIKYLSDDDLKMLSKYMDEKPIDESHETGSDILAGFKSQEQLDGFLEQHGFKYNDMLLVGSDGVWARDINGGKDAEMILAKTEYPTYTDGKPVPSIEHPNDPVRVQNFNDLGPDDVKHFKNLAELVRWIAESDAPIGEEKSVESIGNQDLEVEFLMKLRTGTPEELDTIYKAMDSLVSEKVITDYNMSHTGADVQVESKQSDDSVYTFAYSIEPRHMEKMEKVFRKFRVEWEKTGDQDGEYEGVVTGPKAAVEKFALSTGLCSKKDVGEYVTPLTEAVKPDTTGSLMGGIDTQEDLLKALSDHGFEPWQSGGGFEVLRRDTQDSMGAPEHYELITDAETGEIPQINKTTKVLYGVYGDAEPDGKYRTFDSLDALLSALAAGKPVVESNTELDKVERAGIDKVIEAWKVIRAQVGIMYEAYEQYGLNEVQPDNSQKVIPMSLDEWSLEISQHIADWEHLKVTDF